MRAARILSALLLTILLTIALEAEAVNLNWSSVTTTVDGTDIPALVVYYRVYWSSDDTTWNFAADTGETFMSLDSITAGCFFLHVTAVRSDTDQESDPSQSLQYCYGDVVTPPPETTTAKPDAPEGINVQ